MSDLEQVREDIRQRYPEMFASFVRIMEDMMDTFCKKQNDYGPSNIALGSSLSTDGEIQASSTGVAFRMNDKMQRIVNLVIQQRRPAVEDESVLDSVQDLAVYCVIFLILNSKTSEDLSCWGR